jgi:uncharacterized cupin superfamily protein
MPLAPFATLRASVNSGANQTGGITCAGGETVVLSADPTGALTSFKIEIYDYPPEFALPSGWSSAVDATGATIYFCAPSNGIAPAFTLDTAAHWWKYMFRLTGNNGDNGGNKNIPTSQLIDERTAITVPAGSGIQQVGKNETTQFNPSWAVTLQKNQRVLDAVVGAAVTASAMAPAQLVAISNISSLSGEQTIDGVLTSSSRVLLTGQTSSAQNGLWNTAAGAWTRPSDFNADAKVIAGQTVFITAGASRAATTWQLKSGSTIAGAKVYSQVLAPSAAQPNDLVDTSNLSSLSGEQTTDGTLTSASRVLLVGQATLSQNGPWVTGAGAWERPSDFSSDAQVIAGQFFYVRSGTLGASTTWQLISGSTIAGSKSFVRSLNGANRSPVRLVQTAALPANTANTGAKTLTANANGALALSAFDNPTSYSVGDAIEVNALGVSNGVYVLTQIGDAANPWILTRRSDLNASAQFATGAAYDVLDGTTLKGTRRQLFTQGTITLDTTALTFGAVRQQNLLVVDLTAPPYNVIAFPSTAAAAANTAVAGGDYGPTIRQAVADAAVGTGTTGSSGLFVRIVFPSPGFVLVDTPIETRTRVILDLNGCTLCTSTLDGGHVITSPAHIAPTIGGTPVDTAAGTTPLAMWDTASGNNTVYFNFTHAGMRFGASGDPTTGWTGFECKFLMLVDSIPGAGVLAHIGGCRGRRLADDNGAAHDALDTLFALFLFHDQLRGVLRTTDTTAGVYGAVTQTGGGSSVVTGDGTIKPTNDRAVILRVVVGGTIGAADAKSIQYSSDGGVSYYPAVALGTATSFTIAETYAGNAFAAKFNFAAGTLVAGTTYACPTSGVNQTITLTTTSTSIAPGTIYEGTLRFDGSAVKLCCSAVGATPSEVSAAATGVIVQRPWEETIWGLSTNSGFRESASGGDAAHVYLGSVRILSQTAAPVSPTPSTIPANVTGQRLFFRPSSGNVTNALGGVAPGQLLAPDGSTVLRWRGSIASPLGSALRWAYFQVRRTNGAFANHCSVINGRILQTANRGSSGILLVNCPYHTLKNLVLSGGFDGVQTFGPSFYSQHSNLIFGSLRVPYSTIIASLRISKINIDGGEIMFGSANSYHEASAVELNAETGTVCPVILSTVTGPSKYTFQLDDENVTFSGVVPRELIRASVGLSNSLKISGAIGSGGGISVPLTIGGAPAIPGGKVTLEDVTLNALPAAQCIIRALTVDAPNVSLGPSVSYGEFSGGQRPAQLCNMPGKVVVYGGGQPSGSALADSSPTLVYSDGARRNMATGVLGGNQSAALSVAGVDVSTRWRFFFGVQAHDYAFTNGGPAGGTLRTLSAGFSGPVEFYFNGNDWENY